MPNRSVSEWLTTWFQRTLIVWLLVSSYVALRWTGWFPDATDVFGKSFFTNTYLYLTIAVTMFSIGMMLPRDEVQQVFVRWPTVISGTVIQYLTMPLLAFACAKIAGLDKYQLIGVVMVGCVPGAMASNVLTLNAGGNASYSVSLTTAATLLSPLAVPFALAVTLGTEGAVNWLLLVKSSAILLSIVVIPVIVGHLIGRLQSVASENNVKVIGSTLANLAILIIIAVVVGRNRQRLENLRFDLLWLLLIINLGGYIAGYYGAMILRITNSMRRALTLEIGMQNAGLGATLALTLFPANSEVAIAPAMYTFGCMLTGTVLSGIWAMQPLQHNEQSQTHRDDDSQDTNTDTPN